MKMTPLPVRGWGRGHLSSRPNWAKHAAFVLENAFLSLTLCQSTQRAPTSVPSSPGEAGSTERADALLSMRCIAAANPSYREETESDGVGPRRGWGGVDWGGIRAWLPCTGQSDKSAAGLPGH